MKLGVTCLVLACAAALAVAEGDKGKMAANETGAVAALKQLVSTEGVWRQTDSDRNGAQDYWALDVAGFYGATDANGQAQKYIHVDLARADAKGAARYPSLGASADKAGYWFRVMETDDTGEPYAKDVDGDGKKETNPSKFAFTAYPRAYGETGVHTLIVNEEGVVYAKDLGPDAKEGCDRWPDPEPDTKGWMDSEAMVNALKPPEAAATSSEKDACDALQQLVLTEGVWRQTDSDRNGAQDYWTRDVAGYYYVQDVSGHPLKYIDVQIAKADRLGLGTYMKDPPRPNGGYWLRAMETDDAGKPYVDAELFAPGARPVADRPSTNSGKFAFCAYPAEYGVTGTKTYIVNEEGVLYEKDLGPDAKEGCDTWPDADPTLKGWAWVE